MITNEMIAKYKDLVHRNTHGEVLYEIAKDLRITYYSTIFDSINKIHDLERCLNRDLHEVRDRMRQEFKQYLQTVLNQTDFEQIAIFV